MECLSRLFQLDVGGHLGPLVGLINNEFAELSDRHSRLNAAVREVLNDPAVQKNLQTIGFDPIHQSLAEAEAYFESEVTKWGGMVKELGLSIN